MKELTPEEKKLLALAFLALNQFMDQIEARQAIIMLADKLGVIDELNTYADDLILEKKQKLN